MTGGVALNDRYGYVRRELEGSGKRRTFLGRVVQAVGAWSAAMVPQLTLPRNILLKSCFFSLFVVFAMVCFFFLLSVVLLVL